MAIGGAGATGAKAVTQIEGEPPKRVVVMVWCKRRSNNPSLKRPGIPVAPE